MKLNDIADYKLIVSGLIMFLLFTGINYFLANKPFIFHNQPTKDEITQIATDTREIIKQLSPYESKESMLKVTILENFENSVQNYKQTSTFTKRLSVSGKINQGFLLVRASGDNEPLVNGDDVYVKMSAILPPNYKYQEYGGHLIKSRSLETPKSDNWSEYLYSLDDIKYKENYKQDDVEVISGNWLKLLNEGTNQVTVGFTSTTKKGNIHQLIIYYRCLDGIPCSIKVN